MEKLNLIKIGGKIIDDPILLEECLKAFNTLAGNKILVHGGGKAGSRMLKALDIPILYNEGRRITDVETLRIVTMVYAGEINKKIVAKLQSLGCNALGLSGCDGNIIEAKKREKKEVDYGYAGDIVNINTSMIRDILSLGLVPVINPITHDNSGQLLNTNADTIASALGEKFSSQFKVSIHYCFEMDGVLRDVDDPQSVIEEINTQGFLEMKEKGVISSGMIPKLYNAFNGLHTGVDTITIGNHDHFTGTGLFTTIVI